MDQNRSEPQPLEKIFRRRGDDPIPSADVTACFSNLNDCCVNECLLKFTEDFRIRLNLNLSMLSWKEKEIYMFGLMSIDRKKRVNSKRAKTSEHYKYTVLHYGVSRFVCKTAFISLHDTTPIVVHKLRRKLSTNYMVPADVRGTSKEHPPLDSNTVFAITLHFFATVDYDNFDSCNRHVLEANIPKMWFAFQETQEKRVPYIQYKELVLDMVPNLK